MEFSIRTAPVRHMFESLPNSYSVDIAHPQTLTAIEVDGSSHRTRKWKFLDRRKESVLSALGWSVLRFWNEEVLTDLDRVVRDVETHLNTSTTSK